MVRPSHRSRSLRRVFRRTPGANVKLHYKKRKPSPAKCAETGQILKGVPRERPKAMQKMAKSKKRPERPFGGYLCASALKKRALRFARSLKL